MIASPSMSMAASTACSASSEYGGRRSLYGSRPCGAIEYSTGELDIFPSRALPRRISEKRGGVVRDDERNAVVAMHRAAELPDGERRLEERLCRERAERDDDLWTNDLELTDQVRTACLDFLGTRVPVPWRPMLQDVANEHVLAAQVNGGENLRQELTGRANEREPRLVLVFAWRLADAHQLCRRTALAGHRLRRGLVQRAPRALRDHVGQFVQRAYAA